MKKAISLALVLITALIFASCGKHSHDDAENLTWITIKEPTCTEVGVKELKCNICEEVIETQELEKISHDITYTTTREPNCTDGEKVGTCKNCDFTNTQVIKANKAHSYEYINETITKEPTPLSSGIKEVYYQCSECGEKKTERKTIDALKGWSKGDKIVISSGNKEEVYITYVDCGEYTSYNRYYTPKDGYKYVYIELLFEYVGDDDLYVYCGDCDCYADSFICDEFIFINDNDGGLEAGTLTHGRKTQGKIFFEVPIDAKEIEFEYEIDYNFRITFIYE